MGLGALRQKLRKYIKDFDDDMAKFRENPDAADEDAEKDEDKDDDDLDDDEDQSEQVDAVSKFMKKDKSKSTTPDDIDDDDDSDDSYWGGSSDESSSSSSDEHPGMSLREKFLKKPESEGKK